MLYAANIAGPVESKERHGRPNRNADNRKVGDGIKDSMFSNEEPTNENTKRGGLEAESLGTGHCVPRKETRLPHEKAGGKQGVLGIGWDERT